MGLASIQHKLKLDPCCSLAETLVDTASRACRALDLLRPTEGPIYPSPSMLLVSKTLRKMHGYVARDPCQKNSNPIALD